MRRGYVDHVMFATRAQMRAALRYARRRCHMSPTPLFPALSLIPRRDFRRLSLTSLVSPSRRLIFFRALPSYTMLMMLLPGLYARYAVSDAAEAISGAPDERLHSCEADYVRLSMLDEFC